MTSGLDGAKAIADAVLYEGYLLYPYRASAKKNQVRWQWGVLVPPAYAAAGHGERDRSHTEVLLEPDEADPVLHVRLRFLHLRSRAVLDLDGRPVDTLTVDGVEVSAWDEAVEREHDRAFALHELLDGVTVSVEMPGGDEIEHVDGGRLVRTCRPLHLELRLLAEPQPGPYGVVRLAMDVVNVSPWADLGAGRDVAVRHSPVAAHTVLALTGGRFLSLLEPPEWARGYVRCCRNDGTFPVLVDDRDTVVLASPIILYDHPQIAPESAGELFDGTEIDEILTLRTLTLTDAEKREARATDPRARALLDRVDGMPGDVLERLHGAVRHPEGLARPGEPVPMIATPGTPWWDPGADAHVDPETDSVLVDGVAVSRGSTVVLRPGVRRTDAQDMFLIGRTATVQAVFLDVDGGNHVAVTIDDDPGAELAVAHGRYRYFSPEELEPVP